MLLISYLQVPKHDKVLETPYNCSIPPPFANISSSQLYKTQKKLLYPVNVGRNIARDAAMTHFILASDIELYPNPGLVKKFLEMIARNDEPLQRKNPKVFPLSIFEVDSASQVPRDKTELQELLKTGKAIPFHKRVCSSCHGVPKSKEWMAANETEGMHRTYNFTYQSKFYYTIYFVLCVWTFCFTGEAFLNRKIQILIFHSVSYAMFLKIPLTFFFFTFFLRLRIRHISYWKACWLFCSLGTNLHRYTC